MHVYPMKLTPYISETVWGGKRLIEEYNIDPQGRANCAEAWVLSAHPNGGSVVQNGVYAGMRLDELFPSFPILVKFIDAQDDLSIQVHPRDTDDVLKPGESGKTECWYILDARPGAKLYLGFKEAISREAFAQAIEEGTLMEHVRPFEAKPGEFYFVPAGTLHAIGRGVLLAEVQQSSDTTYRVYDYGRLPPRQLHIEQALAVTDRAPYEHIQQSKIQCAYFSVEEYSGQDVSGIAEEGFVSLLMLAGGAVLTCRGETMSLRKGESLLIPPGAGEYRVTGECRTLVTRGVDDWEKRKERCE